MNKVAYIVNTKKGFKGFIALLIPDGNDSALFPIGHTMIYNTLEEAQCQLKEIATEIKIYMNPIKSSVTGISWLSELEYANK